MKLREVIPLTLAALMLGFYWFFDREKFNKYMDYYPPQEAFMKAIGSALLDLVAICIFLLTMILRYEELKFYLEHSIPGDDLETVG